MPRKKFFIIGLILFFVLIAVFALIKLSGRKTEPGSTKTTTLSSTSNLPSNWKKYENSEYHLGFQYPPDFNIEELAALAPNFLQVNLLKDQRAQAIIMVYGNYEAGDATFFVGSGPVGEKTFSNQAWHLFDFPQGYSDSRPFTVFQIHAESIAKAVV